MDTFTRISVQKAQELVTLKNTTIVDIRDANSFLQGHVPQAQNVNDANIKDFLHHANKDKPLICYCYHGISSQQAAAYFLNQEFKEVYSVDGGWEEWKKVYA